MVHSRIQSLSSNKDRNFKAKCKFYEASKHNYEVTIDPRFQHLTHLLHLEHKTDFPLKSKKTFFCPLSTAYHQVEFQRNLK